MASTGIDADTYRIEQLAGYIADAATTLDERQQEAFRSILRTLQDALSSEPDWRPSLLIDGIADGLQEIWCDQCGRGTIKDGGSLPSGWERRADPAATDGLLLFCDRCIEAGS